jgi:DNA modification methylase
MAVLASELTDRWAAYNGDCLEVMPELPAEVAGLSIYSPPFATKDGGLYHYSSSERDLSNSRNYQEFFDHYAYVVREIHRLTMPGRSSLVHCMDIPSGNTGNDWLIDFPGDIIRLHEREGWKYAGRYHVWKEPLGVRNRTMAKGLTHQTIVEDSNKCSLASADYLLRFKRSGENTVPITHPTGFLDYAGSRQIPADLLKYRDWKGKQTENRYSHWIWRRYADAFWDDIRIDNVVKYKDAREDDDEKHVHPLQLDVIERGVTLWSNPGEVVLSPFAGVGSEGVGAVKLGRKAILLELKASYYRQMLLNLAEVDVPRATQGEFAMEEEVSDLAS